MKKLYFIRHGQTESNVQRISTGHTETPLTAEGRQQAKLAGQEAKNLNIDYIICSPLSRAHETAKIIAKEIGYPINDIEINPLFIERYFGVYENQPWADPGFDFDSIEGIEKTTDLIKRAKQAIKYLESLPHDNIMVVSHGQTGRALRHHLIKGFKFDQSLEHKLPNAEIVRWL